MKKSSILFIILFLVFTSCYAKQNSEAKMTYKSVSMEDGLRLMQNDKDFILLDVRTIEEYNAGHIPNALLLTNETFTKEDAEKLIPNKDTTIYVYCRSGRRSKQASEKLVALGYRNVIEIGGILDYKGEIEK